MKYGDGRGESGVDRYADFLVVEKRTRQSSPPEPLPPYRQSRQPIQPPCRACSPLRGSRCGMTCLAVSDQVAWTLVKPGWMVINANGDTVGHVREVMGDQAADIFNGLLVEHGLLGSNDYVPAEQIAEI